MVSFQRPSDRDYQSVRNWFHNTKPLIGNEDDYILWKEDIVTLRHGREWAGFDGWVEFMLHKIDCAPIRVCSYSSSEAILKADLFLVDVLYRRPSAEDFKQECLLLLTVSRVTTCQHDDHKCDFHLAGSSRSEHV